MRIDEIQNGLADAVSSAAQAIFTPDYVITDAIMDDKNMLRFYAATGKIAVWAGESERTIFGHRAINWLFRAWHDWCHIKSGVCNADHGPLGCFEPIAEYAVADWQCIGLGDKLARIVQIEVSGQAKHFADTGQFVTDQIQFAIAELGG